MALKIIDHGSPEYKQMITLREEILRQPLGLHFDLDELAREKDDVLIGAFDDDKLIGCCLITRAGADSCRLRQMAVPKLLQHKGIGASLMNFAENIARDRGYSVMMMHARKSVVDFYKRFGYRVTSEEFEEITIPHYIMEKRLR